MDVKNSSSVFLHPPRNYILSVFHDEIYIDFFENNGSQLKNPDISGAIFTLSLSIKLVEGAGDARVL